MFGFKTEATFNLLRLQLLHVFFQDSLTLVIWIEFENSVYWIRESGDECVFFGRKTKLKRREEEEGWIKKEIERGVWVDIYR